VLLVACSGAPLTPADTTLVVRELARHAEAQCDALRGKSVPADVDRFCAGMAYATAPVLEPVAPELEAGTGGSL
jgi:hypothetical protein